MFAALLHYLLGINLRKLLLLSTLIEALVGAASNVVGSVIVGVASHLLDLLGEAGTNHVNV